MKTDQDRAVRTSKSFGFVSDWTQALNNNGDLDEALESLRHLLRADVAILSRLPKLDGDAKCISYCEERQEGIRVRPARSHAKALLGDHLSSVQVPSIWMLSEMASGSCDLGGGPLARDACCPSEVLVCPLGADQSHLDCLELHYAHQPARHDLDLMAMLVGTISSAWKRRGPGVISKRISQTRKLRVLPLEENFDAPILDVENPAGLSRCEFRVCLLLQEGMTVKVISETLSIGKATVRSHLSSVFSKTGTNGQVELLHLLNRDRPQDRTVVNG